MVRSMPRFDAAMWVTLEKEMANGLYLPAPVWLKKVKSRPPG